MKTIPRQHEIKVYANETGGVTIEQEDPMGGEPQRVFVTTTSVPTLIDLLGLQAQIAREAAKPKREGF
jgi:hypothetical protein